MAQQLTEEDLKNMSPDELRELQKQNCIFCHIISGRVPGKKIYEDDKCLAILDIRPASQGHILLIPKEHYAMMPMVPEDIQRYLFMIAKQLSHAVLKAMKAAGTTIFLANGAIAGQQAPHVMIHIIPRKEGDDLSKFNLPQHPIRPEDLKKIQLILRKSMSQMMKIDDPELEEELKRLQEGTPTPQPTPAPGPAPPSPADERTEEEILAEQKPEPTPAHTPKQDKEVDLDTISNMFK